MPVLNQKDSARLYKAIADGLDNLPRRCHLGTYDECRFVGGVYVDYKIAGKEGKFADWLAWAIETGVVNPSCYCEGYENQVVAECKQLTPEICERLWEQYWTPKKRSRRANR